MKKDFLFFISLIVFLGIYFLPSNYSFTIIKTDLVPKEACSFGTGSVSVKATATDSISGVYGWLCYKNNSWSTCPASDLCGTYTINGWNDYTMIKAVDKAGNKSDSTYLYNSTYYNFNGKSTGASLITLSADKNAVYITGKDANTGTISSVSIKDTSSVDGKVYISGYPKEVSDTEYSPYYYGASSMPAYECPVGEVVYENGKYMCSAPSYRLQNPTCFCLYDYNSSTKKYSFNASNCEWTTTYCSDEYATSSSNDEYFKIISNREPNDQNDDDSDPNNFNSNLYKRPYDSLCYTYYIGQSKFFIDKSNTQGGLWYYCSTSPYETIDCYKGNLQKALAEKNYKTLPVLDEIRDIMVEASKETDSICDNSSSLVTNTDYYTLNNNNTLCKSLVSKLNDSNKSVSGALTSNSQYIVPIVSSANCNFQKGEAVKNSAPSNSVTETFGNLKYYFYCPDGSTPSKVGSSYQCTGYSEIKTTAYKYDWTVYYYKKW